MTTPTTKSYNDARWDAIKKFETTGKPDTAFYLDGSGYVTIGYGTLVNKNGVTNPYAKAVISNADDPVLAQKMVDAFVGSKGTAAEVKTSLEGKGFVFDGSKIIGFKDGVDANGKPVVTDIKNVLSEAGATKVTEGTIFVEKEKLVDGIETQLKTHFNEEQRAAMLSRVYNGVPLKEDIDALADKGTPEATLSFFASNRGGPDDANPGHYARTIEEAREFLGDSVKAATVGNAKDFTYTDKDGNEVFIGSQSEKVGGSTKAEFVGYKVVTNDDQTQTQVPLDIPALGKKGSMQFADAAHLPLDPSVEFNNAYLTGDPVKMLAALSLDPTIKTPRAALDELRKYAPELGEEQDINLGTDAKPQWVKGYVTTDDEEHTTVLAVGKDAKGKPALVGYEIDAPTDANPNPEPHAIPVTAPQSKLPALKTSDAGDTDGTVQIADVGDPESQDQSDTPSDFHTALLEAFTNPTRPNTSGPTTQYAGPGLPEIASAPSPTPEPNPNSLSSYFQSQGTALSPKQQDALASQVNQLKLSGSGDLSYYPLPDGSTLIANADGDLVGQLSAPRNGEISLHANAIAEDGSATTHERYITTDGQTTSYSPHTLAQVNAGLSLLQGLDGLQHWDQMGDVARFSSLVGLASSYNALSGGALGDLGKLGTAASVLGLFQALQDGNTAGTIPGVDAVSRGAIDGAINEVLEHVGSDIPYMSIALALNNITKHRGKSFEAFVDMRFDKPVNDDCMRKVA